MDNSDIIEIEVSKIVKLLTIRKKEFFKKRISNKFDESVIRKLHGWHYKIVKHKKKTYLLIARYSKFIYEGDLRFNIKSIKFKHNIENEIKLHIRMKRIEKIRVINNGNVLTHKLKRNTIIIYGHEIKSNKISLEIRYYNTLLQEYRDAVVDLELISYYYLRSRKVINRYELHEDVDSDITNKIVLKDFRKITKRTSDSLDLSRTFYYDRNNQEKHYLRDANLQKYESFTDSNRNFKRVVSEQLLNENKLRKEVSYKNDILRIRRTYEYNDEGLIKYSYSTYNYKGLETKYISYTRNEITDKYNVYKHLTEGNEDSYERYTVSQQEVKNFLARL